MDQHRKWVFIINPVAGNGYANTLAGKIREMIAIYGLDADLVFTERKGHATELSELYASRGYNFIIGVGGDGTMNEIASPLVFREGVTVGLIAGGTGNDFIQITGFPDRFEQKDWDMFFKASVMELDAGRCNGKFFLNGMGLGFDAKVASENYTKSGEVKPGGKIKYLWHILKNLLFYREQRMKMTCNGSTYETDCFMNTVANGRRFAGAFYLTPKALANDSLLDICAIKRLSLFQRLRILTMVPSGSHINDKRIEYYQTDRLSIEFPSPVPFHVDGELFFASNFEIGVLPRALRVIYNPERANFFNVAQEEDVSADELNLLHG